MNIFSDIGRVHSDKITVNAGNDSFIDFLASSYYKVDVNPI